MTERANFTRDEARRVGSEIGIDWASAPFDVEQFRIGMDVELEHGLHDPVTDVTGSDPLVTGKIALAHLNEFPDYSHTAWTHGGGGKARPRDRLSPGCPERSWSANTASLRWAGHQHVSNRRTTWATLQSAGFRRRLTDGAPVTNRTARSTTASPSPLLPASQIDHRPTCTSLDRLPAHRLTSAPPIVYDSPVTTVPGWSPDVFANWPVGYGYETPDFHVHMFGFGAARYLPPRAVRQASGSVARTVERPSRPCISSSTRSNGCSCRSSRPGRAWAPGRRCASS